MLSACCGKLLSKSSEKRSRKYLKDGKARDPEVAGKSGANGRQNAQQQSVTAEAPVVTEKNKINHLNAEELREWNSRAGGLNAVRIRNMQPENVTFCSPRQILDGIRLMPQELGRGTYGIVVTGNYRGVSCAVKVMLSSGDLDRAAIRELLLGPSLVHPNIVSTFASRCALLTDEFFDLLEGPRQPNDREATTPGAPRTLDPVPLNSGDGFGDPGGHLGNEPEPMVVLHNLMYTLQAKTGQALVVTVQQFCNHGTLENAIRKGIFLLGRLNPMRWNDRVVMRALMRTVGEIARGLLHLHDAGVVHGDLKPANVLLDGAPEDRRAFIAKVADFGLSHVLPNAANSMFTESWGSIAYMAPEAFDGKVSRATDVWAFGVVLWEMLTGQRPYKGMKVPQVVRGVKEGYLQLQWPSSPAMTPRLIALGERCLAHRPADRPALLAIMEELVEIEREIRAALLTDAAVAKPAAAAAAEGDVGNADCKQADDCDNALLGVSTVLLSSTPEGFGGSAISPLTRVSPSGAAPPPSPPPPLPGAQPGAVTAFTQDLVSVGHRTDGGEYFF